MTTTPSFFMRPLPPSCIPFSSAEGRKLLAESLPSCPAYFSLIEQFHTQNEPAFCGLSTLVMVLNALRIDPGRQWKGPWRWFYEGMLDCCVPLEVVKERGMSLDEFVCLAACNGASPVLYRPALDGGGDEESSTPCDEETFRRIIRESCLTVVDSQDHTSNGSSSGDGDDEDGDDGVDDGEFRPPPAAPAAAAAPVTAESPRFRCSDESGSKDGGGEKEDDDDGEAAAAEDAALIESAFFTSFSKWLCGR
mmetsp:Transcript_24468/g.48818  ORF Transcript_24468/g.48818 Transcript_24468/m.48818 type:complete len:250 (+) Transcript_24468:141-890(+)